MIKATTDFPKKKKQIFKQLIDDNFLFVKFLHHTLCIYLICMHNL
jgi:hypothetical protein